MSVSELYESVYSAALATLHSIHEHQSSLANFIYLPMLVVSGSQLRSRPQTLYRSLFSTAIHHSHFCSVAAKSRSRTQLTRKVSSSLCATCGLVSLRSGLYLKWTECAYLCVPVVIETSRPVDRNNTIYIKYLPHYASASGSELVSALRIRRVEPRKSANIEELLHFVNFSKLL